MITKMIKKFGQSEKGATAIEYGLIAAGISIAIATVVLLVGSKLVALFQRIADAL